MAKPGVPRPAQSQQPQRPQSPANNGITVIPLEIGGTFSSGDPSTIPAGHSVLLRNHLIRPNRKDGRPPATYDNLMSIVGLSTWEDLVNQQTRFLALDATKLYLKSTVNETWNAGTATVTGTRLTDSVSYRGNWYGMMDDGAGSPTAAISWDGTNVSSTPFNSTIYARAIAAFNDRLYLAYPRLTIAPAQPAVVTNAYDWTDSTKWSATNTNVAILTVGASTKVGRLSPTSLATSGCKIIYQTNDSPAQGMISVAASTSELFYAWRADLRGVDPLYRVPITLEWVIIKGRVNTTAYAVGDVIVIAASDTNNYRYRCTVAGTSAGAPPTFSPTLGSSTTDGANIIWKNEGSDVIAALETTVTNATEAQWTTYAVTCQVPARTNAVYVTPRIKFYNTTYPALTTLAPVDISFKDGLADGDARKTNRGQQWTAGDHIFPFINTETATTATVNLETLIWSEIANPKSIRGVNTYEVKEEAGLPTALKVVAGRLVLFKRRGFWVFQGTADPDVPIQAEGAATIGVGCLGPRAVDVMEDEIFWLAENEAMRMRIGNYPRPLGGEAMREEIFNKAAATWVESQATYNMPLLAVDKKNREVWAYAQKGFLHCYHMADEDIPGVYRPYTPEKGMWTKHDINGQEIRAMAWNPVTGEMEFSIGGGGLVRFDPTVSPAKDQQDNTANTYNATMDIIFKPIEHLGEAGERHDVTLHWIGVYHLATAAQAGQTLTAYVSFDRGVTYPKSIQVQFDPTAARIPIGLYQTGPSITVKLSYVGKASAAAWSISRAEAGIEIHRPEYPQVQPTVLSSNL